MPLYAWICSVCGIVLLTPWDCIASLLVRVCGDQIYTQDGRLIAVTSQEGAVRADVREVTGLGYRHAFLEFVREALNSEYIDASSNTGMFEESIIRVEWYTLWHVLEKNKVPRRIQLWHPRDSSWYNGCIWFCLLGVLTKDRNIHLWKNLLFTISLGLTREGKGSGS